MRQTPIALLMMLMMAVCLPMMASAQTGARETQAFIPESGFYWNPSQPGSGYAIEIQDRQLFMTVYTYTESNNVNNRDPLWFSSLGNVTSSGTGDNVSYTFSDDLLFSEDGQCLGCGFVTPDTSNTLRPVEIIFTSVSTADMLIDGETVPLQRFWYSASIQDAIFALFGQWVAVTDCTADVDNNCYGDNLLQPFEGDLLQIDTEGNSNGERTAEGIRPGTDIEVAASYNADQQLYVIVVAERNVEFLAYYFFNEDFGTDQIQATAERFIPGNLLNGIGFPSYLRRISDRTFVETGTPQVASGQTLKSGQARNNQIITPRTLVAQPDFKSSQRSMADPEHLALLNQMVTDLARQLASEDRVR